MQEGKTKVKKKEQNKNSALKEEIKIPNPCYYEKSNSPKKREKEKREKEKVNTTLGKRRQMQECYWRMPDKNPTAETATQTACSSGKGTATEQRWELQIRRLGTFLSEIREENKCNIQRKRNLRDPDVLEGQQRRGSHKGKKL